MEHRHLTDPRALRAMAHPVRLGLMELLAVEGPLTATECAARLGQTPANCSFHLRQLAAHGFIEEADSGPGRRRPWRVIVRGHDWDTGPDVSPAQRAAGELLTQVLVDWELNRLRTWDQRRDRETKQWQDAAVLTQSGALLTAEELRDIGVKINGLFAQYADRVDPARRPPGVRLVSGLAFFHPVVDNSYTVGDLEVAGDA